MNAIIEVELTAKMQNLLNGMKASEAAVSQFAVNSEGKVIGFTKSIQKLEAQAKTFEKALKTATDPVRVDLLNRSLAVTQTRLSAANKVIGVNQFGNLAKGSNQATAALTDVGRVMQDLPYGIMGISNNLNPLIESFSRLRAASGSNVGAFKALLGSLAGGGGLGLAISAITAAMGFAAIGMQMWGSRTKTAKEATVEYISTLDDLSRAHLQGAQDAVKESSNLKVLYAAYQDGNLPLTKRKEIYGELQRLYPAYFGNIDFEEVATKKTALAYDKLANSIIATARARSATDIISKNTTRQLENQQKINEIEQKREKDRLVTSQALYRLREEERKGGMAAGGGMANSSRFAARESEAAQKRQLDFLNQQRVLKTDSNILDERNGKLIKYITDQIAKGADITTTKEPKEKKIREEKIKDTKTLSDVLAELSKEYTKIDLLSGVAFGEKQNKKFEATQKAISELVEMGYKPASKEIQNLIDKQLDFINVQNKVISGIVKPAKDYNTTLTPTKIENDPFAAIEAQYAARLEKQKEFQSSMQSLISEGANNTIGSMAEALGDSLVNGGNVIEAMGSALLGAFGGFLKEYGRLLVAYGTAAVLKSKLDAAALIPGAGLIAGPAAIAAGVALMVAGSAINAFASGKGQNNKQAKVERQTAFANGGIAYGRTNALIGEYSGARSNPEVVAPLDKLNAILAPSINKSIANSLGSMMGFKIASGSGKVGTKDLGGDGVQSIKAKSTEPIIIATETRLEGETIVISTDRAKKRMSRTR